MLGYVQDAEESCEDSFLRAFHKIVDFEGRSAFKNWLYGIVDNRCEEARRKAARRNQHHAKMIEEVEHQKLTNNKTSHDEVTGKAN